MGLKEGAIETAKTIEKVTGRGAVITGIGSTIFNLFSLEPFVGLATIWGGTKIARKTILEPVRK